MLELSEFVIHIYTQSLCFTPFEPYCPLFSCLTIHYKPATSNIIYPSLAKWGPVRIVDVYVLVNEDDSKMKREFIERNQCRRKKKL